MPGSLRGTYASREMDKARSAKLPFRMTAKAEKMEISCISDVEFALSSFFSPWQKTEGNEVSHFTIAVLVCTIPESWKCILLLFDRWFEKKIASTLGRVFLFIGHLMPLITPKQTVIQTVFLEQRDIGCIIQYLNQPSVAISNLRGIWWANRRLATAKL